MAVVCCIKGFRLCSRDLLELDVIYFWIRRPGMGFRGFWGFMSYYVNHGDVIKAVFDAAVEVARG